MKTRCRRTTVHYQRGKRNGGRNLAKMNLPRGKEKEKREDQTINRSTLERTVRIKALRIKGTQLVEQKGRESWERLPARYGKKEGG